MKRYIIIYYEPNNDFIKTYKIRNDGQEVQLGVYSEAEIDNQLAYLTGRYLTYSFGRVRIA